MVYYYITYPIDIPNDYTVKTVVFDGNPIDNWINLLGNEISFTVANKPKTAEIIVTLQYTPSKSNASETEVEQLLKRDDV